MLREKVSAEQAYLIETKRNAALYNPSNPDGNHQRRRIREHNVPIITQAGQELSQQPWQLNRIYQMALPGLWCNGTVGSEVQRFFLTWQIDTGWQLPFMSLRIVDRLAQKEAARRVWHLVNCPKAIFIVSSSSTEMGYEGNGLGSALLALSESFLNAMLHHLECWQKIDAAELLGKSIWAIIRDQAQASASCLLDHEKEQILEQDGSVVATKRRQWTTSKTARLLPGYTKSYREVERQVGPLPWNIGRASFFARHECRAYGDQSAEKYFARLRETR